MTRITFPKKTVRVDNTYHCTCGHKFYRKLSDWFTINPFNSKPEHECRQEIKERLLATTKTCPKCKQEVPPKNKAK